MDCGLIRVKLLFSQGLNPKLRQAARGEQSRVWRHLEPESCHDVMTRSSTRHVNISFVFTTCHKWCFSLAKEKKKRKKKKQLAKDEKNGEKYYGSQKTDRCQFYRHQSHSIINSVKYVFFFFFWCNGNVIQSRPSVIFTLFF